MRAAAVAEGGDGTEPACRSAGPDEGAKDDDCTGRGVDQAGAPGRVVRTRMRLWVLLLLLLLLLWLWLYVPDEGWSEVCPTLERAPVPALRASCGEPAESADSTDAVAVVVRLVLDSGRDGSEVSR
jgi:hypothetical protein